MPDINLTLPYPPSVNHYWDSKAVKSKKQNRWVVLKYLSKRAKQFRERIDVEVFAQLGQRPRIEDRIIIQVIEHYGPSDPTKTYEGAAQDIDNCLKPLFDALEHAGVYVNDSQIDGLVVVKGRRAAVGRVEVKIIVIGDEQWSLELKRPPGSCETSTSERRTTATSESSPVT